MRLFKIKGPYITLGQFIKVEDFVSSGGMVKNFLIDAKIKLNGSKENRRGKKIYPNDQLEIEGQLYKFVNDWIYSFKKF